MLIIAYIALSQILKLALRANCGVRTYSICMSATSIPNNISMSGSDLK